MTWPGDSIQVDCVCMHHADIVYFQPPTLAYVASATTPPRCHPLDWIGCHPRTRRSTSRHKLVGLLNFIAVQPIYFEPISVLDENRDESSRKLKKVM